MRQKQKIKLFLFILFIHLTGCGSSKIKSQYIIAEKFWNERNYEAAVIEFEKVTKIDSESELGKQALFRAAMTEAVFLKKYKSAIQKFQIYIKLNPGEDKIWESNLQIGEILFNYSQNFEAALIHYQNLLNQFKKAKNTPEIYFRIGKSFSNLQDFNKSIEAYEELIRTFPKYESIDEVYFEKALNFVVLGEFKSQKIAKKIGKTDFFEGIKQLNEFINKFPRSKHVPEAQFWIANSAEENGDLKNAILQYRELLRKYPNQNVIRLKLYSLNRKKK